VLALVACATARPAAKAEATASAPPAVLAHGLDPALESDPYPSTYRPLPSRPTAIVGATVLTATGSRIDDGTVLLRDGKIVQVTAGLAPPAGYDVVDGRGKWVTPGVIDAHSHLGVYPHPGLDSLQDGNELTDPDTAQVWAEHSIWPQDPGFNMARAGGVTSLLILPGSGNLFGGRSVTLKNVPSTTVQGMKFPGAPYSLKMACGENPKRVYGGKGRSPFTRMGNMAGYRAAWINAADYARKWDAYRDKVAKGEKADPPKRDLQLDTLSGVLRGDIRVQNHCYRADEMAFMVDLAKEFGYRITAFHHATEAYKIADLLVANDICIATWGGWWGYKFEAFDAIEENAALVNAAKGCVAIHSDDGTTIQHLNRETAIAVSAGRRAGLQISEEEAVKWFTANPARILGILDRTGTLEAGKDADVVIWNHDPFSVYATTEKVFIDGALAYDAHDPRFQSRSDFDIGQPAEETRP
jgi:imidazolonepropionase-like amidohydrolase